MVHLHLLLCVTVVRKHINLGDDVEGQLVGKFLHGYWLAVQSLAALLKELLHSRGTRSAGSLVAAHVHTLDMTQILNGL